jgi:hypothetical protein
MSKPEHEFFDVANAPWAPVVGLPGLHKRVLVRDAETGDWTGMTKFDPGTDTTALGVQRHDFWEEILIVEGSLLDLSLDETFTRGMYACRPPGMAHGPWVSPNGCITFEVCMYLRVKT